MQWKKQQKSTQKINETSSQIRSKIDQTSSQNLPKMGPKSALEPTSLRSPFLYRFWTDFGPNFGPSWGPSCGHVCQKINFWKFPKACKNDHDFQHPSGPSWDRFWSGLGIQNRAKIGPRSVSKAITKQMQKSSKSLAGAVFLRMRRIEKRSKINKKSF